MLKSDLQFLIKVGEDVAIMKDVLLYIWDNYIGYAPAKPDTNLLNDPC